MALAGRAEQRKNPNPQGKGMVPVLRDWAALRPGTAVAKTPDVLLRDYCISYLVVFFSFRFKPVIGKSYFLYARVDDWMMSLIAPHEWGQRDPGAFLGCCRLRPDMTWEIETSPNDEVDTVALEKAQAFVRGFVDTLAGQEAMHEELPFYVSGLPYYQRLLATALATSLQRSMPEGRFDEVEALLHQLSDWLLPDDHQDEVANAQAKFTHA